MNSWLTLLNVKEGEEGKRNPFSKYHDKKGAALDGGSGCDYKAFITFGVWWYIKLIKEFQMVRQSYLRIIIYSLRYLKYLSM